LLFEHFSNKLAHFVSFARQELLLELDSAKQLRSVEFGRAGSNGRRIFVFPLVAVAQTAEAIQSQLSLLGWSQMFLDVYPLGVGSGNSCFFHEFCREIFELFQRLYFASSLAHFVLSFFFDEEDVVVSFSYQRVFHLFSLKPHEHLIFLLGHFVSQGLLLFLLLLLLVLSFTLFLFGCIMANKIVL